MMTTQYRNSVIYKDSFLKPIQDCIEKNIAVVKGIRQPTGFGKTWTAARIAIDSFVENDVSTIYMAHVKKLVADFESELHTAISERGLLILVYRLYARSDYLEDKNLLDEIISFCQELKQRLPHLNKNQTQNLFSSGSTTHEPMPEDAPTSFESQFTKLEKTISYYNSRLAKLEFLKHDVELAKEINNTLLNITS